MLCFNDRETMRESPQVCKQLRVITLDCYRLKELEFYRKYDQLMESSERMVKMLLQKNSKVPLKLVQKNDKFLWTIYLSKDRIEQLIKNHREPNKF